MGWTSGRPVASPVTQRTSGYVTGTLGYRCGTYIPYIMSMAAAIDITLACEIYSDLRHINELNVRNPYILYGTSSPAGRLKHYTSVRDIFRLAACITHLRHACISSILPQCAGASDFLHGCNCRRQTREK